MKKPDSKEFQSRFFLWVLFWPWNMLWTLLNVSMAPLLELLHKLILLPGRLFTAIQEEIDSVLENITEQEFSGVNEDFQMREESPVSAPTHAESVLPNEPANPHARALQHPDRRNQADIELRVLAVPARPGHLSESAGSTRASATGGESATA